MEDTLTDKVNVFSSEAHLIWLKSKNKKMGAAYERFYNGEKDPVARKDYESSGKYSAYRYFSMLGGKHAFLFVVFPALGEWCVRRVDTGSRDDVKTYSEKPSRAQIEKDIKNWIEGLGWYFRRREKNSCDYISSVDEINFGKNYKIKEFSSAIDAMFYWKRLR